MCVRLASKIQEINISADPSGRSLVGIVGSNPAGCMGVPWKCFLLSGRGLCDRSIPRPEESYRVWCVIKCHKSFTPTVSRYIEVEIKKERKKDGIKSTFVHTG